MGKARNETEFKIAREPNLVLANREARLRAPSGLAESGQIQWAAVAAAHEMASKNSKSLIVEYIYNKVRTYFSKNC